MYLVRQAVETVPLYTGTANLAGQRHYFGDCRLAAMKARVEAGDLRHAREPLDDRFNRREIVRLVKRSERHQLAQFFENVRRDDRGTGELRSAVDDAMADTEYAGAAVRRTKPGGERIERRAAITHDGPVEGSFVETRAGAILRGELRRRPDPLDLAARFQPPGFDRRPPVDTELEARRPGIEHDCVVVHSAHSDQTVIAL